MSINVALPLECVMARMLVESVLATKGARTVTLKPVYSNDPASPNHSFGKYTPNGSISLCITNPAAWPLFEPGASIDIRFERTADSGA